MVRISQSTAAVADALTSATVTSPHRSGWTTNSRSTTRTATQLITPDADPVA